jgi:catechol 2,3-dioxygenase-like lactoylglutathione lyase family enzyme
VKEWKMKIKSIEHIAISVKNSTASAKWYCDMLGFEIASKSDSTPPVYFMKDPSGVCFLEIINAADPSKLTHAQTNNRHFHIAFDVNDWDAVHEELALKGVKFEEATHVGGLKSGFFRDPDGVPLQIVHRDKPLK